MRNKLLFSTVALLAGVTLASAQQAPGGQPGGGMERQAPQTQPVPEGKRGKDQQGQQGQPQRGKDQTTGQAPGQMQREEGKDQKGQPPRAKDQRGKDDKGTTGQRDQRDQGQGQTQQRPEGTPKQSQPQREQGREGEGKQGQQGAQKGGGDSMTAEQRTKVRQQVLGSGAPRVTNVNFSVSVGTVVPQHVRVIAVPDVIVEIHPQWRGHLYFVVEDRIIIVDSNHRIVAILVV